MAKSLAGSVLAQRDGSKRTGAELKDDASMVMRSKKFSPETKAFAATVMSQSEKSHLLSVQDINTQEARRLFYELYDQWKPYHDAVRKLRVDVTQAFSGVAKGGSKNPSFGDA